MLATFEPSKNMTQDSSLYSISRMAGGAVPRVMGWGRFDFGERKKNSRFFKLKNIQNCKKTMTNYNFWKIIRKFVIFLTFYQNIRDNLCEEIRNLWKYGIVGGLGGRAPPPHKLAWKTMENWSFCNFSEILANFDFGKLIIIKTKTILMEFRKYLIRLKEVKKRIDKSLLVWEKTS